LYGKSNPQMKNSFLLTILVLGGYCLFLGAGAFAFLPLALRDQEAKNVLYEQVAKKTHRIESLRQDYVFNNIYDRDRANELYAEILSIMRRFYQKQITRMDIPALGVAFSAGTLGLVFLVTGLAALIPVAWVAQSLRVGMGLWVVFMVFYGWNVYLEVDFVDAVYARTLQLTQHFLPGEGVKEYRLLVRELTNFSISRGLLVFGAGSLLYFLGPLFLLSRRDVRGILRLDNNPSVKE